MIDGWIQTAGAVLAGPGQLAIYFFAFASVLALEAVFPRFAIRTPLLKRARRHGGLLLINQIVIRGLVLFAGWQLSYNLQQSGIGLLGWLAPMPLWLELVLAFVLLDLFAYWLHRFSHTWQPLWRMHLVHHADLEVDSLSSLRHHPFEAVVVVVTRMASVLIVAPSLVVLVLRDTFIMFWDFFSHGNIRVSPRIDRVLRVLFITPATHRVHHSVTPVETNSNYGAVLSIWDRLFGTWRVLDPEAQERMVVGLEYYRADRDQTLGAMLAQPLTYRPSGRALAGEQELAVKPNG